MQNVSFVNHKSVNKLHTSVKVNLLFLALTKLMKSVNPLTFGVEFTFLFIPLLQIC